MINSTLRSPSARRGLSRHEFCRLVPVLLVLSVLVGFLSASGPSAAAPRLASGSSAPAASSTGCGRSASAGSSDLRLEIGGHQRFVIVHIPSHYVSTKPVALVLNLHGSQSDATQQEIFSGMDLTADKDGFLVAYPQALIPAGGGFDWNIPGVPLVGGSYPPKNAANDITFLVDLVNDLRSRYCIDSRRVFATGVSGGGRMSSQLACDEPGVFAAVAPVAGLRFPSPCPARRAVPVIAFHGTADPIDPYNGHGEAYWTYSVPTAAHRWAVHNHCASTPRTVSGSGYKLTEYSGCADGASVRLYSLIGEGHEWPGGPHMPPSITALLGPQSNAVDANAVMWAFFSSHPMP